MEAMAAEKLNNDLRFIRLPEEVHNILCNGKRLTGMEKMLYGQVYTENKMFGEWAKTTYADCKELGISRSSSARGLDKLVQGNVFDKGERRSKYSIKAEEAAKEDSTDDTTKTNNYIPIYHFLLNAEIEIDNQQVKNHGKIKRIRYNAVEVLCFFIRHYLNPKRKKGEVFSGGEEFVADKFGISTSTACEIISELCSAKLNGKRIFARQMVYRDVNGDQIIVEKQKGSSNKYKSAYIVTDYILDICRDIEKQLKKRREQIKAEKARREQEEQELEAGYAQHGDLKERAENVKKERSSKPRGMSWEAWRREQSIRLLRKLCEQEESKQSTEEFVSEEVQVQTPPTPPPKQEPERVWKTDEQKCIEIDKCFKHDDEYQELNSKRKELHNKAVAAILACDSSADTLEAECEKAENALRAFLLQHGVKSEELPRQFLTPRY